MSSGEGDALRGNSEHIARGEFQNVLFDIRDSLNQIREMHKQYGHQLTQHQLDDKKMFDQFSISLHNIDGTLDTLLDDYDNRQIHKTKKEETLRMFQNGAVDVIFKIGISAAAAIGILSWLKP